MEILSGKISGVSFWGGKDSASLCAASVQWDPEAGLNTAAVEMKVHVHRLNSPFSSQDLTVFLNIISSLVSPEALVPFDSH